MSVTSANGYTGIATSPTGESSLASESGEMKVGEMGEVVGKSVEKASLVAKLQELQALKEEAIAKFDGDIEALKRVLSFM